MSCTPFDSFSKQLLEAFLIPLWEAQLNQEVPGESQFVDERFNNTLPQRASRLVGKTWSFSKDLNNHPKATSCGVCKSALELHSRLQ